MIKPTIGRVVWFYPAGHQSSDQPLAALVAFVHHDRSVNLATFDQWGNTYPVGTVPLLQDDDEAPYGGFYATWPGAEDDIVQQRDEDLPEDDED